MFTLSPSLSLSYEHGVMLIWHADGITPCATRNETIDALAAYGVDASDAIDAIHACLAVARDMAMAR